MRLMILAKSARGSRPRRGRGARRQPIASGYAAAPRQTRAALPTREAPDLRPDRHPDDRIAVERAGEKDLLTASPATATE